MLGGVYWLDVCEFPKFQACEKLAPCDDELLKLKVSGTVQPKPLALKLTFGSGLTVMYAGLISASATPFALVATSVMVNVPAVLNAWVALVVVAALPSPKSH
jgi:hypothetical protein